MSQQGIHAGHSSSPQGPNPPVAGDSSAGKGLGIAGFVVGVVAIVFSFIPCIGMYAMFPGILGLILSAVSIRQASRGGAPKGLAIAGLTCAILSVLIGYGQYKAVDTAATELKKTSEEIDKELENLKHRK